jgi:CLIP-associating protein 1/2
MMGSDDDSLLLAQAVPIPDDDSDSDEHSVNLMSFSAPFEMYPPITPSQPKNKSAPVSFSPNSNDSKPTAGVSNALSSGSVPDMAGGQLVVEDALRARAEQAESAAERLLELVEPDVDGMHHSTIPASLLVGSSNGHAVPKAKHKPIPIPIRQAHLATPVTPVNRNAAIMRTAAMFQDSPAAHNGRTSLMDVLQDMKHETGWWLKRKSCKCIVELQNRDCA